jgi:hypothetical protein
VEQGDSVCSGKDHAELDLDTAGDMCKGAEAFSAMHPGDTPGTRVSVEMCELKLHRNLTE